jgi:uncharacterized phiE125 gp8 family phage protein
MSAILIDGPGAEPVSLAEAKAFLRLEHDDEDGLVAALITAARLHVEAATRRLLVTQNWRIVRDRWPGGIVPIPLAPLQSVVGVRLFPEEGAAATVPSADYWLDAASTPARLVARRGFREPGRPVAGIEIDVVAGYGDAAEVPEPLRQAIRLLVAHWFEDRLLVGAADLLLPKTVDALIAPYRVLAP